MEASIAVETVSASASTPAHSITVGGDSFWGAFRDLPREHGWEPLRVEGTLPEELQGTLFRTGPALGSSFGQRYRHWFDGDGGVYGVRFSGGRAEGAARIVESRGLLEERRKGKRIFGGYGTKTPN